MEEAGMRQFILLLIFSFSLALSGEIKRVEVGNLVLEGVPEISQELKDRLLQYQNARSASFRDWLPDGSGILVSTRFGETTQLHILRQPLGMRKQITFFNEPVGGGSFSKDADTHGFLFSKDAGGNEVGQIYYFDMESGNYKMLSDGKSRNGGAVWSNKGDRFCYITTKRNGRDFDIYIGYIHDMSKTYPVLEDKGVWFATDWSPDDSKLLVSKYVSANESHYYILDLKTGKREQINPSDKKISYAGAVFSKDGLGIYFTSDENSEFHHLRYYSLKSKKIEDLTPNLKWDVESIALSDNGHYLAYTVNEDGIDKLHVLDIREQPINELKLPELPFGLIYGISFSPDSKRLSMVFNTAVSPGDVYIYNLENKKLTRWTESEVGGLNTATFPSPSLIHYPTFDKVDGKPRLIPAFLFQPKNKKGPFPVVIQIHGGPEGQYTPYFSSSLQFLLNELGVAVIAPNVRGSAGYGKSYLKLDNGFKREESVKDIGALLDWIATRKNLDKDRVAVFGGSYGGYMVLSSMFNYNERLRCGVDVVGISNFVTFLKNTKEYRRDLRRAEYGDERDPKMAEFLQKISPTTNAYKITKPLFVVQGLNDPRVPVTEAEQMVKIVRKNGGDVWYMMAKDEGHGFRKKTNRDYYTAAVVMFLEKYLLK